VSDKKHISAYRQHEEKATEHVFSFGNPCYRFHSQRMEREYQRHECAAPERSRHASEDEKKDARRQCVQQHIDKMVRPGMPIEKLAIEHVRDGSERMPVAAVRMG